MHHLSAKNPVSEIAFESRIAKQNSKPTSSFLRENNSLILKNLRQFTSVSPDKSNMVSQDEKLVNTEAHNR